MLSQVSPGLSDITNSQLLFRLVLKLEYLDHHWWHGDPYWCKESGLAMMGTTKGILSQTLYICISQRYFNLTFSGMHEPQSTKSRKLLSLQTNHFSFPKLQFSYKNHGFWRCRNNFVSKLGRTCWWRSHFHIEIQKITPRNVPDIWNTKN